jgi:large subunit ribosomal protein L10
MRPEKQLLLDEIKDHIEKFSSFVLLSYRGIDPNLASEFRTLIYNTGGFFFVIRKRIFVRAANEAGIPLSREELQGHLGVVYAKDDPIATTKALYRFKNEERGEIEILGGRFEGSFYSPKEVEELSKLPSQEQMRAKFLGVLEAPMSGTLAIMDAILSSVVNCIANKIEKYTQNE